MRRISTALVALLLVPLMASPTRAGRILYVDADATGAGYGATWTDAYRSLQDALAAAFNGDEIRVAQGSYKPDTGRGKTLGDRTASFWLVNGVALKGGYAGFGEAKPDARDVTLYKTILSGDLKGDDTGDVDHPSRNENTYNVVRAEGVIKTTVLDGFIITGGNANWMGGGMLLGNSSLTVIDCTISKNLAANCGGGLSSGGGTPTFTRCTFDENWAGYFGCGAYLDHCDATLVDCVFTNNRGEHGGGLANEWGSPTLTRCTFRGNSVKGDCGGMRNGYGSPKLIDCLFSQNSSTGSGAGMSNNLTDHGGSPILTHCTFEENQAGWFGGGIVNDGGTATLISCTFKGNSGYRGGGMCNGYSGAGGSVTAVNCAFVGNLGTASGGGVEMISGNAAFTNCTFTGNAASLNGAALANSGGWASDVTVTNCILWDDTPVEIAGGANIVTYSDVQGGTGQPWFGEGCLDIDPLFANPNGRLSLGSPCIDAGDNAAVPPDITTDLDGNQRIQGAVVDMGAYEGVEPPAKRICTLTVSSTPGGSVVTPGEGAFLYNEGEVAVVEAVAQSGYGFARWSGTAADAGKVVDPGSASTSVIVDGDYTLVANFEHSGPTYTVEDFESGTFGAGWSWPQYPRWYITSEDAHSGKYSARAGRIGDEETTTLSLQRTVAEGKITFWRRVSTEDMYTFSIDGKVQETVTGEHPWQEVSFPVSAGAHTFVWKYRKDDSSHRGEDTVFIDDVSLPVPP